MKTLRLLSKEIRDLEGTIIVDGAKNTPLTFGKIIASSLAIQKQSTDSIRTLSTAMKIRDAKSEVELEDADFSEALSAVKENPQLSVLIAGQVLEAFVDKK